MADKFYQNPWIGQHMYTRVVINVASGHWALVDMHLYIRSYQQGHPRHFQSQCGEIFGFPCALEYFQKSVSWSVEILQQINSYQCVVHWCPNIITAVQKATATFSTKGMKYGAQTVQESSFLHIYLTQKWLQQEFLATFFKFGTGVEKIRELRQYTRQTLPPRYYPHPACFPFPKTFCHWGPVLKFLYLFASERRLAWVDVFALRLSSWMCLQWLPKGLLSTSLVQVSHCYLDSPMTRALPVWFIVISQ